MQINQLSTRSHEENTQKEKASKNTTFAGIIVPICQYIT